RDARGARRRRGRERRVGLGTVTEMPRARVLATSAIALAGLFVVGSLAGEAWFFRPVPDRVPVVPRAVAGAPGPLMIGILDGLRAEAVAEAGTDAPLPFWRSLAAE